MTECGITALQAKPSLLGQMGIARIVNKRSHRTLGYYISARYEERIAGILQQIEREEKLDKLRQIRALNETEWSETGVEDGIE
jgi:hypothetical protein